MESYGLNSYTDDLINILFEKIKFLHIVDIKAIWLLELICWTIEIYFATKVGVGILIEKILQRKKLLAVPE